MAPASLDHCIWPVIEDCIFRISWPSASMLAPWRVRWVCFKTPCKPSFVVERARTGNKWLNLLQLAVFIRALGFACFISQKQNAPL